MQFFPFLHNQADAVASSAVGGALAISHAAAAVPPLPPGAPWWAGWLFSVAVAAVPIVVVRGLAAWAAGKEAEAAAHREIARDRLTDNVPGNDGEALDMLAKARRLEAEAAQLRGLGGRNGNDG